MEIPTEPDKRLVYFDYLQEQGKKLGFIRTIPNITKFTKEVFEQVVSDEMFFFDVKESIPIYDWEWEGVVIPKERIVSRDDSINVFKLSTIIGNYRISSVGSLWSPTLAIRRTPIISNVIPILENNLNYGIVNITGLTFGSNLKTKGGQIIIDYQTMVFWKGAEFVSFEDSSLFSRESLSKEEITNWHYVFCAYHSVLEKE